MKTKLSPFVYKVKGARNVLLFDSMKKQLFSISPQGDPLELETQLLENGLVIKTNGVIPFKFIPRVTETYREQMILKELQIRITGHCQSECEACGETGSCIKDITRLNAETLSILSRQLGNIAIESLVILGGNPFLEPEQVENVKSKIKALNYKILCPPSLSDQYREETKRIENTGVEITPSVCSTGNISEEKMSVDVNEFHYNQKYNPCWGNKLAIETNGDIKPCLWSGKIIGNIKNSHIASLILTQKCEPYWELTKEKINICKDCEFRYSCPDCRVIAEKQTGNLYGKTFGCRYSPGTGEW